MARRQVRGSATSADTSAVATLDAVAAKFAARSIEVEIIGLNPHSEALHRRVSGHLTGTH